MEWIKGWDSRRHSKYASVLFASLLVLGTGSVEVAVAEPNAASQKLFIDGEPTIPASNGEVVEPKPFTPPITKLVRELSPAVVNISVEGAQEELSTGGDEPKKPGAGGDEAQKNEPGSGGPTPPSPGGPSVDSLGSGFIISPDGYIVTSNHVVEKSRNVIIRLLDDKKEYPAKVIGRDLKTDIALLKIESKVPLKITYLGDSDAVEVGEWVVAIGNQFQLGQTVTAGIVSAKSRRIPTVRASPYDAFIQTDASINPGSSGGPLFNVRGQVIGVNTAIFSPGRSQFGGTGFNIGIGFAIPINLVKNVISQLKEKGRVIRGVLGVMIQPVTTDVAEALGLESPIGALVSDVVPESPAAVAGFKRRDIITGFAQNKIDDYDSLPLLVADTPIGTTVPVELVREGKKITLSVKIAELSDKAARPEPVKSKPDEVGLYLQGITPDIAKSLSLSRSTGVIVTGVEPGSIGEKAGIVRGDILEEIAGNKIETVDGFATLVKSISKSKPVLLLVRRPEGTRFLTLKFPR